MSTAALLTRPDSAVPATPDERSPYAIAQDSLGALVDTVVHAARVEAMHQAMQLDLIRLAIEVAARAEVAFTSPRLSSTRRREIARRSIIAELATAMHLPEQTVARLADEGWALAERLPETFEGMRRGEFSLAHARVAIDQSDGLAPEALARFDHEISALAGTMTAATLRRRARRLREQLTAETLHDRHRAALAERRIELEPARDGMAWLHAFLPATEALLIHDRLTRFAAACDPSRVASVEAGSGSPERSSSVDAVASGTRSAGATAPSIVAGPRGSDTSRTLDQRRADAFRDLLIDGRTDGGVTGRSIAPTVAVTVPVLTLLGARDEPATLDGYGPIDADTARRLATHAPSFTRILTHPVTGAVLDVDRRSYRPPAELATWVRLRDETCRFPGCNRSARGCDLDHTVAWVDGGRTAHDNLAHLCSAHHHLKHESSWSVRAIGDGALEWRSPSGRRHTTVPAVSIERGSSGRPHSVPHGVPPSGPDDGPHGAAQPRLHPGSPPGGPPARAGSPDQSDPPPF
ncbi:HNH endonuclease signature motif containing protein [Agromyces larvae]|uniref:HNH endonuclease n=1 Tax=Agromyces larvae TaxID=2929802 RepID=A0ABY4BV08_9MICO|nr:HNH endonuclease signature motif containing protein [Agromyces larvae]UOE43023.1 HNH endonuclease [Agromyces larvae]